MNNIAKRFIISLLATVIVTVGMARELTTKDISVRYEKSDHPGRFRVTYIKNNYDKRVTVFIANEFDDNVTPIHLGIGEERAGIDLTCTVVRALADGETVYVVLRNDKKGKGKESEKPAVASQKQDNSQTVANIKDVTPPPVKLIKKDTLLSKYILYLEDNPFLSRKNIEEDSIKVQDFVDKLSSNSVNRADFIRENHIVSFSDSLKETLGNYEQLKEEIIAVFLKRYEVGYEIEQHKECEDSMNAIISQRLGLRMAMQSRLQNALSESQATSTDPSLKISWLTVSVSTALLLLLVALLVWYHKVNKKYTNVNRVRGKSNNSPVSSGESTIVVVGSPKPLALKRQDISDVVGSEAYMKIDCSEICTDTAVRTMYLKNSCIKDIYNMYADDLRDPEKMNEDGCMVIGRWVKDEKSGKYDVTLEEIVRPGDDAIFSEYELNFGGKIKLKLSDRLRRLRRDTDMQYDLTCWVHSHPGLGVFFSSADSNVHQQLSRPSCPMALTAMVIDILTPEQETGIFTFKPDGSINSKTELKRMYSLEEMYKWAVDSTRRTIRPDDYFGTLGKATKHRNECYGVELSNGAVIDMALLAAEQRSGFVAIAHGFVIEKDGRFISIVNTVTTEQSVADEEAQGCFVVASHCSIPTVRRTVTAYLDKVRFILVYTAADDLLTTIPVVDHELCGDEDFYGEQKLEDLKIWTKRRR